MRYVLYISTLCFLISCKNSTEEKMADDTSKTTEKVSEKTLMEWDDDSLIYPEEKHFKNIRQVTFGGDNATVQSTSALSHEFPGLQSTIAVLISEEKLR